MHTEKQPWETTQEGNQSETSQKENRFQSNETTQCKFSNLETIQKTSNKKTGVEKPNRTGMPDRLKSGLENLSGYDLSPVRVHYNSPKPKQIGALAYTQGTNIHIGPGQQKHLPHEGWHVIQQMQGRVKPTLQMKGLSINNQKNLEDEAEFMGSRLKYTKFYQDEGHISRSGNNWPPANVLQLKSITYDGNCFRNFELLARDLQNHEFKPSISEENALKNWLTDNIDHVFDNFEHFLTQLKHESDLANVHDSDFANVRDIVESIKQKYPPDNYFYVGLGKSPTPIIAYLQAEGEEEIVNMPLSKFTHAFDKSSKKEPLFSGQLSKPQLAELHTHFDRFIPTNEKLNGRKLLLIDFVTSGRSLISTQKHLEQYLKKKYGPKGFWCCKTPDETPVLVPLALHQKDSNTRFVDDYAINKLELEEHLAVTIGNTEKFKPRAEYPDDFRVDKGHKSEKIKRSDKYDELVLEFKQWIKKVGKKPDQADIDLINLIT